MTKDRNPNQHLMDTYKRATKALIKLSQDPILPHNVSKDLRWAVNYLDIYWSKSVPGTLEIPTDKIVVDRHKAFMDNR